MPKTKEKPADPLSNFESTIKSLESIVAKLEGEETTLEEALKEFETGIKLTRAAQKALNDAEQTVRLLLEVDGAPSSTPFSPEESQE